VRLSGAPRLLDAGFIAEHTHGFDEFATAMRATTWQEVEGHAQLSRAAIEAAARLRIPCDVYLRDSGNW
jgi:anaerobic selenocysteine-containing dehydrogenase